jgi:hypothetical protein
MRKINMAAVSALILATATYAGAEGIKVNFDGGKPYIISAEIAVPAAPAPAAGITAGVKCGHVTGEITQLHFLAQPAKNKLFTYAETEPMFKEFVAMWMPILEKFDLKPAGVEYKNSLGSLKYESANGMEIRDFLAEPLHYNALDPADMAKLQRELLAPLEKAGMTPVASFNIKNPALRPTFNIYYLTKPDEDPAREIRLRHLMNGEDIDFDVIENSVQFVKKDAPYSLVYIGKELGFKTKWSATEEGVKTKLEEYKKYLKANNKDFIGSKIVKIDPPYVSGSTTINYIVNMYFFQ